jgi:hypothetical protein
LSSCVIFIIIEISTMEYCFNKALDCFACLSSNCTFAIFENLAAICTNNRSLLSGVIFKELERGGERLCPLPTSTVANKIILDHSWGPGDYGNF